MVHAFFEGLLLILQWKAFLYLCIGVVIGYAVGILPGLGGSCTLALMLPFIYKMTPAEAFAFLLGMHSVCQTAGDITSILFGIPGEPTTVAMIVDGYPMSKRGEGGRAVGAALTSSMIGVTIGALVLLFSIPIVRPLVLGLGSPEMLMVILLGLTCISSLSGRGKRALLLGFLSAGFGFLCSMVGQEHHAGILRFTLGQLYLWSGIPIVPVMVGFFAIPEIIDLAIRGTSIAGDLPEGKITAGVWDGVKDVFKHFWLTVRCSMVGVFIGILPGVGGGVAQWVSYAHATQSAKTEEERDGFGKGDIRGVIGAGASIGREGSALIPTVSFGIPTGPSMAILLGAFFIMGIIPGPDMLTKYLPLTLSFVWILVLSNVITVVASLFIVNHMAKATLVRGHIMIMFILLLCFIGAYCESNDIGAVVVMLIFGALGYLMVVHNFPRPPFILAFVLGQMAENYYYISTERYGFDWLYRPKVIVIFLLAVLTCAYPFIQEKRRLRTGGIHEN
jgi:putative tricarboxylic transport membrane protein